MGYSEAEVWGSIVLERLECGVGSFWSCNSGVLDEHYVTLYKHLEEAHHILQGADWKIEKFSPAISLCKWNFTLRTKICCFMVSLSVRQVLGCLMVVTFVGVSICFYEFRVGINKASFITWVCCARSGCDQKEACSTGYIKPAGPDGGYTPVRYKVSSLSIESVRDIKH